LSRAPISASVAAVAISCPWPLRPARSADDRKQTSRRRRASHQIGVPVRWTPSRQDTGVVGTIRERRATVHGAIQEPNWQ
jgi:hypothetical protein